MGAEMAICTNPFGYDEEEEDGEQLKPTESNGKKSSSKSSSSTSGRLHKWDTALLTDHLLGLRRTVLF